MISETALSIAVGASAQAAAYSPRAIRSANTREIVFFIYKSIHLRLENKGFIGRKQEGFQNVKCCVTIAEVKRLLPEWGTSTGSKSYMRIQFVLYGNKSYTSV
jgi:hypothetical protein